MARRLSFAVGIVATALVGCFPAPPVDAETVFVVHGLGRTHRSMAVLESRLEANGYRVVTFAYPSRSEPIEVLVAQLGDAVARCCAERAHTVHFVTHSMGGVLVRAYLAQQAEPHEGRVVMLAPPGQGSEIIDAFAESALLDRVLGPAARQLATDSTGIASRLAPVRFELGVLAGDRSVNPVTSWLIPGVDDGKVAVERARIEGMTDFKVVPASHTFIMNRAEVAEDVIRFLRDGRFD